LNHIRGVDVVGREAHEPVEAELVLLLRRAHLGAEQAEEEADERAAGTSAVNLRAGGAKVVVQRGACRRLLNGKGS
jgi:hypothetical protein